MTQSTRRPELSFDGKGINGPNEYRRRMFTMRQPDNTKDAVMLAKYGRLLAAAPDLLAALEALCEQRSLTHRYWGEGDNTLASDKAVADARAAIAKAKGE